MKYFEAFTGLGGFSKGIEQAYDNSDQYESEKPEQANGASGRVRFTVSGRTDVLSANDASLCDGGGRECLNQSASDSPRSEQCQAASSNTSIRTLETTAMQPELFATSCQTSTFSAADFLVKISQLLENDKALITPEALCFLRSHGFYHTKDRDIFYSKTLKACLVLTLEKVSRKYLGFSPNSTTVLKQLCLTRSTLAFPRTANVSFLSDILQDNVPEKYFLSEKAMANIVKSMDDQAIYQRASTAIITKESPTASAAEAVKES